MTKRTLVVDLATAEIGKSDATKYWREALQSGPPYPLHWCGAFALWALREAKLTGWHWAIGKGFLWRLPRTKNPKPGDMGYQDQPFQHHFVVTEVGEHTFTSVDGNQGNPGVQLRNRKMDVYKYAFYSIEPLLGDGAEDTKPQARGLATLRLGSTGADVVELQSRLNLHMAAGLKTDGAFGQKTEGAVKTFQRDKGLVADGVVGPKTWERLLKS
jgi:hypothetical protein